jgi:magnesium-transporting ATPase (P-type)
VVLRERDGATEKSRSRRFAAGDVVVVRAGDRVAVDGRVLAGESVVNEAMLTGESVPVAKVPGDRVYAGTVNERGPLRCEATGVGQATLLAAIVRQVAAAQGSKAPVQRLVDPRRRAVRAGGSRDRRNHVRRQRNPRRRLGGGADARDRGARYQRVRARSASQPPPR